MIFLVSSVLASLLAVLIATQKIHLVNFSLSKQILIVGLIWLCLAGIFYASITWLSSRSITFRALFSTDGSWSDWFQKFFLAGFLIFPVSIILFVQLKALILLFLHQPVTGFYGSALPDTPLRSQITAFLVFGALLIFLVFRFGKAASIRRFLEELPDVYYVLIIFLLGSIARIIFIELINTQPRSDFALIETDAALWAQGSTPASLYVSSHVVQTLIYGVLYAVFGQNLLVLKLFHVVVYGLAGIFLYFTAKRVLGNKLWAGISGLLLVSWPSLALYSNVLTPEHMFILLECALLFVLSLFFSNGEAGQGEKRTIARDLLLFLIIGLLVGLAGLFRPFGQLFLVAFIVTLFLWRPEAKAVRSNIAGVLIILIASWSLGKIPDAVARAYNFQIPYIRPCNLLVGLNIDTAGRWNLDDYYLCKQIRSESASQSEVTKRVLEIVRDRLQGKLNLFVPFLSNKFTLVWQNSSETLSWTLPPDREISQEDLHLINQVNVVDFVLMLIGTFACLAGTVIAFFRGLKPVVFFSLAVLFGFNFMEIFFEVQNRYRTVVMPLFIFFACWSCSALYLSLLKSKESIELSTHP